MTGQIQYVCLILSKEYIRSHFEDIKTYANVIEQRLDNTDYTMELALRDNLRTLELCKKYGADYLLIEDKYPIDWTGEF